MNLDNSNKWLTLIANFGVLTGIIFLGWEIQQNSELMRIQISQSRAESSMTSLALEFNSEYIPQIRVKVEAGEALTPVEDMRYSQWFRAANRIQDNILYQYNSGMLLENTPGSVRGFIEAVVASTRQSRQTWSEMKETFTEDYVQLVDEVFASTDVKY